MINKHTVPGLLLLSLLAFWAKGVDYAWIGSYLPLGVASVVTLILGFSWWASGIARKWSVRIWACLLVLWGVARLLLGLVVVFTDTLREQHVYAQFGWWGTGLSLAVLAVGVLLLYPVQGGLGFAARRYRDG